MNLRMAKKKDFYLHDAHVETVFINEYLPKAPGDFVKVYLYGRMYAEYGMQPDERLMEREFGMTAAGIREAWSYWADLGVVRLHSEKSGSGLPDIEFVDLKEQIFGNGEDPDREEDASSGTAAFTEDTGARSAAGNTDAAGDAGAEARESRAESDFPAGGRAGISAGGAGSTDEGHESPSGTGNIYEPVRDTEISSMFRDIEVLLNRSLSSGELQEILSWIKDDDIPVELVLYAISYSLEKGKSSLRYISTVAHGWMESGLRTAEQVEAHQENFGKRYDQYRRVLKALGFNRNATEQERKMMDRWFDDFGFDIDDVLDAAAKTTGISNPNFNYVNKVLLNRRDAEGAAGEGRNQVSASVLNRYYEYLRSEARREADERTAEVYRKFSRIRDIDTEIQTEGAALSRELLRGNDKRKSRNIRKNLDDLQDERANILTGHNYPRDYTDMKYKCEKCKDTGITDLGGRCTCVIERSQEAAVWIREQETQKGTPSGSR